MPTTVTTPDDLTPLLARLDALEQGHELQSEALAAHEQRLTARENADSAQASAIAGNTAEIGKLNARVTALEMPVPVPPPVGPKVKIGAYYLDIARMGIAKSRGITYGHVRTSPTVPCLSYLNAASNAGMDGVFVELGWRANDGVACFTHADITATLTPVLTHPMVKGIMLVDEPDHQGKRYDPAEILAAYNHVKTLTTSIPVLNVMTWERELSGNTSFLPSAGYVPASDLVGEDRYPVPYGSPAENFVRAGVQKAKAAAGAKPVVACIQTFDWNNLFGPSRPPTPDEVRKMGLAAINEGVGTIFCYSFGELVAECPPVWADFAAITATWQAAA